ncbi:MAG: hypothetical protein ACHRXM_24810 [Isosphaerales bacterium]
MSGNQSKTDEPAGLPANPLMEMWSKYLEQSGLQTQAAMEGLQSFADPQRFQQSWLDALSHSLEGFMRTPAFLEALKVNLKTMTDMKKMQDQMIEDTARHIGAPLASDIHGLFERLNVIEQSILARLSAIEEKLEALEPKTPKKAGQGHQGSSHS